MMIIPISEALMRVVMLFLRGPVAGAPANDRHVAQILPFGMAEGSSPPPLPRALRDGSARRVALRKSASGPPSGKRRCDEAALGSVPSRCWALFGLPARSAGRPQPLSGRPAAQTAREKFQIFADGGKEARGRAWGPNQMRCLMAWGSIWKCLDQTRHNSLTANWISTFNRHFRIVRSPHHDARHPLAACAM